MLILTRRDDEPLVIRFGDQEAIITIRQRHGDQFRVRVEAPDEVEVIRGELLEE